MHGNDENKGTLENPVKTIERGIGILRGYEGRKTLFLREGTYYMEKPLLLTNVDEHLTISSYQNEKVVYLVLKKLK